MKWKRWLRTFESRWGRSGGRGGRRGGCFDWEGGRLPTAGGGSQHPGAFERDHGPGWGGHSVVEKPWEKKNEKKKTRHQLPVWVHETKVSITDDEEFYCVSGVFYFSLCICLHYYPGYNSHPDTSFQSEECSVGAECQTEVWALTATVDVCHGSQQGWHLENGSADNHCHQPLMNERNNGLVCTLVWVCVCVLSHFWGMDVESQYMIQRSSLRKIQIPLSVLNE